MTNNKNSKQTYDEKERLIWGLVVYAGLLKQADMPRVGIPANTAGNWKRRYEKEIHLIAGITDLLLGDSLETS